MTTLQIELPPKLIPVFEGETDVRGAYGGRGSAKTRSFAKMFAVKGAILAAADVRGLLVSAREYMNSLADSSFAEIKTAILEDEWLNSVYDCGEKYIRTKCGRIEMAFVGLRHNLDSIKSKARILICWIDEAEHVSELAYEKLEPTIREEGSELWVTWNRERKGSATDKRFIQNPDPSWKVVELNWRDNPWFPEKLDRMRLRYRDQFPDQYDHIWEGDYKTIFKGAYYAKSLTLAKEQGRIGPVPLEPLVSVHTYHDLGGASQRADAYTMVCSQFVGKEIRVLNYYETIGQQPADHVAWLKTWCIENGVKICYVHLPHDGSHVQINQSWEGLWKAASDEDVKFVVTVAQPLGGGAAMMRVRAGQAQFHRIWFNDDTTNGLRDALAAYAEKWDEDRDIGLGPNHNWASHGADAFGEMCVQYSERKGEQPTERDKYADRKRKRKSAWAA